MAFLALKMKPKTIAQARRNMIKYLKNQGNYKISDFKGMSYNEIRLIFEKVWDFNQHIEPMDMEHGSEKIKSPKKIEEEEVDTQKEMKEVVKESEAKRKKSLPRKRRTVKRQKLEEDAEKEELKGFLDIIPREDVAEDVESLSTKQDVRGVVQIVKEWYSASSLKEDLYVIMIDSYLVKDSLWCIKGDPRIDQGVGSTVTAIEESKDLSSLALDELIGNLKVHEVVMEKDSKIYKGKKERVKSISLKAKKESSDDETSTSGSDDEEYAMAIRNFKKFFRRKGKFVRQPREEKKSFQQRDEKKGKSDQKCFRCGDPNHLIGDCLKPPRNKDQKAFTRGSWSDSKNDAEDKITDETCLMA
ncbi:zf-CCHC domain-containing protein [Tanacetum coccineum]|uniref:Zf-CCHC domain-containing protein n=1 Tax=Tanacetum coccineum TaxID=301880 RepID=A0ABQ5GUU4_9ASTR